MPVPPASPSEFYHQAIEASREEPATVVQDFPPLPTNIDYPLLKQRLDNDLGPINKARGEALPHDAAIDLVVAFIRCLNFFLHIEEGNIFGEMRWVEKKEGLKQ